MKTDPDFVACPIWRRANPIGGVRVEAGGKLRGIAPGAPAQGLRTPAPARMSQTEAAALPVGAII